jgi:PAS domain S-box-containing protein
MQTPGPDLYRDLVEFAPDALILVDATGTIIYANAHSHTLFGYEPGALNGISVEELIPNESRSSHAAHRKSYAREPQLREMGKRGMPLFGLRRDGSRFRAEIRLAPIHTPGGIVSAAAVRDATESERIIDMLAAARQSAEEANEAKGRLLAAASHDLRQPMQSLRLLNGALKRLIHDTAVVEVLEQEERALSTMSDLLHALLNIAKLESGTLQPTVSDTSVPMIFEDLRQQFSALARLKNLEMSIVAPDVHVRTDAILLRELLQNLLANAVRYTDSGQVTLRCVPDQPGRVLMEVEDTGMGIPEAMQEKIFEDFFQAASRGSTHRGGTGLGLGIVRRLSKVLGIPVRVASTVGVGTCFTIEVPAIERPSTSTHDALGTTGMAHNKGQHIILAEDDRAMRDALKIYLQLDDHQVHTAASLTELDALLRTLEACPSIVISDFHLGTHERGSDAIEMIRRHFKSALPAILLTGDTSAVPARLAGEAGIRILNKPVDGQRLVAVVDELLHSHPQ